MSKYPEVIFPSATEVNGPSEVGYGVIQNILSGTTKKDYDAYLSYLMDAGYEPMPCDKRYEGSTTYVAAFRKGNSFISLRHALDKKTWVAFYEDEEYHTWDAKGVFEDVPNADATLAKHAGDGNYVICMEETTKESYNDYLKLLEQNGFTKYADNGLGLGGTVFTATYIKGELVLTVTYLEKTKRTYLSAGFHQPLSDHLHYDENDMANGIEGRQTTLAMLKMIRLGSSFIIQLKNGHYIVNDGGLGCELDALLAYLEENAPNGEKPVIEAWVISHTHPDHSGVVVMIAENPEYADRIQVDGIYYTVPSEDKQALHPASIQYQILGLQDAAKLMHTEIYRMHTGQRYYFHDITMDILIATEQVPMEIHSSDFNDTSTWCLYTIEGQTYMIAGDADSGASQIFSEIYEKDYWNFDIFTAFHHGSNTSDFVTEHCGFQTILVPRTEQPQKHPEENARLKAKSKEWFIKGEGTRLLTFPYHVGESKVLKEFDCIAYHEEGNASVKL